MTSLISSSIGCATDLEISFLVSVRLILVCNVTCYNIFMYADDHSRVKLKELAGVDNSDYINANYMDVR